MRIHEYITESKFTSKQQVIDYFVKRGKTAAQGASAWERGWRGPVEKKPKLSTSEPRTDWQHKWEKSVDEMIGPVGRTSTHSPNTYKPKPRRVEPVEPGVKVDIRREKPRDPEEFVYKRPVSKNTNEVAKIKLSKDPNDLGAYVRDGGKPEPTVMLPIKKINQVFEPDDLHQTKLGAVDRIKQMVIAIRQGKSLPPILVRRHKHGYQVLDGHHRLKAYKIAKVTKIPVRIVDAKNITGDVDESGYDNDAMRRATGTMESKITETKSKMHKSAKAAIPGASSSGVPDDSNGPSNYYHKYRVGVAMASSPDTADVSNIGPTSDDMVTIGYTAADRQIADRAYRVMGYKKKKVTNDHSKEIDVNAVSPVAKPKKNRYGI